MLIVPNVRAALFATALMFAATLLLVSGIALWLDYRGAVQRAEATTRDMALILEEYAKRTFETSDNVLKDIAQFAKERGGAAALRDTTAAREYLLQLSRESSSSDLFLVVDKNGLPSASTAQHPGPNIQLRDQNWFRALMDGADRVVGQAGVDPVTGEIFFTYTHRLTDARGAFDGAAQVAVRPTFFQEVTHGGDETVDVLGREIRLAMWKSDGQVVAKTGLDLKGIATNIMGSTLFTEHLAARVGTFHASSLEDRTEQVVSFRRLERWPVTVTASIPLETLLAPWWSRLGWTLAILSVVLGGLGWLTLSGSSLSRNEEDARLELKRLNEQLSMANSSLHQALADKIVLLQEVHHRVKNNLAITSSLLRLQARRLTDPDAIAALKDTEDRLRSVALIHEALYRSDAAGSVKLDEYLLRLVSEVALAHGAAERAIAVKVHAEAIEVPLERAVPLALAVTEAISNAFKHAFEENSGGDITVSAKERQDGFEIVVRDTGGGRESLAYPADQPASMGSRLIQAFAGQIGASVTYENDNGMVFRMRVPGPSSVPCGDA